VDYSRKAETRFLRPNPLRFGGYKENGFLEQPNKRARGKSAAGSHLSPRSRRLNRQSALS
jgi:hypothetical protein